MTAAELLEDLRRLRVELTPDGPDLRVRAPKGVVTPALRARLVEHKAGLLALLDGEAEITAPVTFAQRRLWFIDQLAPGSSAYHVAIRLRLRGALDARALSGALEEIARRHDPLRARFEVVEGEPVQRIGAPPAVPLAPVDVTSAEADRRADEEARRPFDLRAGPPFRASLLRLAAQDHLLLFTVHHIAFDGTSTGVLMREMSALYAAFVHGRPSPLPAPAVRYAELARRRRAAAPARDEATGDAAPPLSLPTDRRRPAVPAFRGERAALPLSRALVDGVEALGRAEGATPFVTMLAAFQVLLARWAGQTDFAVGAPAADRDEPGLDALIGFFVQTLVVRADLDGDPSFRVLIGRVRRATLEAQARADVPFEDRVEALRPARDPGRSPLFQVMFNLINLPDATPRLPGLTAELGETMPGARFDLTLYAYVEGAAPRLEVAYDADLFDGARMRELLRQLASLFAQVVAAPDRAVGALSLLTREAAAALPDPRAPLPPRWSEALHASFARQARRVPQRIALAAAAGAWTYADLDARSARVAGALCAAGVVAGDRVAVFADRSPSLVCALLGVLRSGAAFVVLDRRHPARRLVDYLAASRPTAIVRLASAGAVPEALAACIDEAGLRVALELAPDGALAPPGSAPLDDVPAAPDALAYVTFTSGTSGAPRPIAGSHGPTAHFVAWQAEHFALGEDDRFALLSGLGHDPLLRDVFTPLSLGATLCVPDDDPELLDEPAAWLAAEAVSVIHVTPATARLLVRSGDALPSLRHAFFGGDALTHGLVAELRALAPAAAILNFYGATETPQAMGFHVVADAPLDRTPERAPLGRGIDGVQLLVVDAGGTLAGVGELGEIEVRTPYLALGYFGDEAATRARFLPDAHGGGGRYRTGDLGRFRPDGSVETCGRADRQRKLRGVRVEPGEIEAALAAHPAVREAVAVVSDGEDAQLLAYVALREDAAPGLSAELREHLRARLPAALVPTAFVLLDALPRTPNGKIDARALPPPLPGGASPAQAPRTPVEELLAGLYGALLGAGAVAGHDGFFDLGGHSLLATRLVSRIRDLFGVTLPLRAVFEAPTVAGLAARIERALRGEGEIAAAAPRLQAARRAPGDARREPSFAQRRLWFLDQLLDRRDHAGDEGYRTARWLRLRGPLCATSLDRALAEIERRHEVLRTTFLASADGELHARVAAPRASVLEIADLASVPEPQRAAEALLAAEAARPFDLAHGPLHRALLAQISPDESLLSLTLHHAVSDGWSLGLIMAELSALYAAFHRGAPSPLPEPAIQYADHARWQRGLVEGGALAADLAWWKARLSGLAPLDLPTCRPRPAAQSFAGARAARVVPAPLAQAVRRLAAAEGATPFMVLLAAFDVVLWRYTGQDDVAIGVPVENRAHTATEGLVGLFLNVLVLRASLAGAPTFRALLQRVREAALGAFSRREVPFELVVEALGAELDRGRTPLFQAFFNLLDVSGHHVTLPGVEVEALERPDPPARFDLTLHAVLDGDRLDLALVYCRDLFEPPQAEAMLDHLLEALLSAVGDPEQPIGALRLSPPPAPALSRRQEPGFVAFAADALDRSIGARFEEMARLHPARVAVRTATGELSYRALDARADGVAAALATVPAQGDRGRVALLLGHDAAMVAAILGALKAGRTYVPLEPAWPRERLALLVDDAGAGVVIARGPTLALARAVAPGAVVLDVDALPDAAPPRLAVAPDAPAYILYTSGSTGVPKGVVQTHRNVIAHLRAYTDRLSLRAEDRLSLLSTYAFDAAVMDIFGALLNGAALCPIDPRGAGLAELAARLRASDVTVYHSTPSLFRHLMNSLGAEATLDGVRLVVLGGEEARRDDLHAFRRHFAPGCVLVNGLGPTESTLALQWFADHATPAPRASLPIGRAAPHVEVTLHNAAGEQVALFGAGEIRVRSAHVALGYWRREELTRAAFSGEPGGPRTYRTGDEARLLPGGDLEFVSRRDAQVKVRGHRVEPGEIEAHLRASPGVRDAVVTARPGADGGARLDAWVVPREGASLDAAALRAALRERLPAHLVPSSIALVAELPLTATGKIDRRALASGAAATSVTSAPGPNAPEDALERALVGAWEEVLGVSPVSVHDDFFALGGHSLLAVRLVERVNRRAAPLGVARALTLAALFQGASVAQVARALRRGAEPEAALVALRASGARWPFVCVIPPGARAASLLSALARCFDADRPLYALQLAPLSGEATIEEAAAGACRALRRFWPRGPYLFGGYSAGGVIAFEAAGQLLRDGGEVPVLALIDVAAPTTDAARMLDGRDDEGWAARFEAHVAAAGDAAAAHLAGAPEELRGAFAYYRDNGHRNAAAVARYRPARRAGALALFRAHERRMVADPALGWRDLAAGPLEILAVPGNHETLLMPPNVDALAAALRRCLDEAECGRRGG